MKKLFLLLAFILPAITFVSCSDDDNENGGNDNNKKYLYKISVKEHEYKFGKPANYGEDYEDYIFDERGNLIKKSTNYYNALAGRIPNSYEYTYDENNRLIESEYYMITLEERCFYEYNDIDSISKMIVYYGDGDLKETWTYEYGIDRKLIKSTCIDSFGTEINNYSYKDNTITCVTYNDGVLFGTTIKEYDTYNNLLKSTWINGETGKESVNESNIYEYEDGKIKKVSSTKGVSNQTTHKEYYYNENETIDKIHVSNDYNSKESDLIYKYIYK